MIRRRRLLLGALPLAAFGLTTGARRGGAGSPARAFEVTRSEQEWKERLTPEQFYVLRQHGTERAGTSLLDGEERPGTYLCAGTVGAHRAYAPWRTCGRRKLRSRPIKPASAGRRPTARGAARVRRADARSGDDRYRPVEQDFFEAHAAAQRDRLDAGRAR